MKFAKTNSPGAVLRRAAVLGGLLGIALGGMAAGAGAQTTPNPNQTTQATPYSWPGFHAGGTALYPFYDAAAPAAGTSPTNPGATPYQALSPLYSMLMGTPTGFLPTTLNPDGTLSPGVSLATEISSFLLGNYSPLQPPPSEAAAVGTSLIYFPNHFADDAYAGGIRSWSAPFTYLTPPSNGQSVTDDDSSGTAGQTYTAAGTALGWTVSFTASGAFAGVGSPSAADNPITPTGAPGYVRAGAAPIPTTAAAAAALATATWQFKAPKSTPANPTVAGLYTVSLHLPDPATDGSETRIPDAHYVIKNITVPAKPVTLFDGRISQTETNDPQYLAGPFAIAPSDTITVTLDNSTAVDLTNTSLNYFALADSVSLTPGSIAGGANTVNSSVTAINVTQFPEIGDAFYLGQSTSLTNRTRTDDATPYGNATIGTRDTSATGVQHNLNQLVYFGRYETIILTDARGNLVGADGKPTDINGNQITTPVTEQVGAIYCVNGITGDIVWRFQTPDVLTPTLVNGVSTLVRTSGSRASFTTPSVARINVLVPQGTTPETYAPATKLVVITADDNGQVYCLDAIGNRNGVSNTYVLGGGGVVGANTPASAFYNQPIYAPNAPLNTGTTIDITTTLPHVGTTRAYWVYRPDQTKESQPGTALGKIRDYDRTRDLPVPGPFSTASPTISVDPTRGIDTATLRPDVLASTSTLASNATVFIGNSNGTLYALDAAGVPVAEQPASGTTARYLDSGPAGDKFNTSSYVGISSFPITTNVPYTLTADGSPVPTAKPVWWFAANGAQTNNPDATANVGITSAPALRLTADPAGGAPNATTTSFDAAAQLYFATGNDTTNQGRVWAVGLAGPVTYTTTGGATTPTALLPGSAGYNNVARPDWVFPNAFTNTGIKKIRPPLGSITGSPVVFTNPDDQTTRVYVAANSNEDDVTPATGGRIWAIRAFAESANFTNTGSASTNAAGEPVWCYPDYYNPNVYAPNTNETPPAKSLGGGSSYNTSNNLIPDPLGAFQFATPAIGVVQFPQNINYGAAGNTPYIHTDNSTNGAGNRTSTDVRGQSVPMLYIGSRTESPDSSTFYALDLDGSTDNQRNIFYFTNVTTPAPVGTTPSAAGFECSPLLVVNSSIVSAANPSPNGATGPGNGGVVFITGTDNNLYELSAVPTSDIDPGTGTTPTNSIAPQFPTFIQLGGFGPFSSPTAAAFSGTNIIATGTGVLAGGGALDFVYGGDSKLGFARGITPANLLGTGGEGIDTGLGTGFTGVDTAAPVQVQLQFPLHTYIFDGKTNDPTQKGSGQTANMGLANNVGETLPAFEWGEPVYIRISNVVPPNDAVLNGADFTFTSGVTSHRDRFMADPASDPNQKTIYTNGGPITIQLTDVAVPGATNTIVETDSVTVPATVLPDALTAPTGPGLNTNPPGNGFLHEAPSGSGAQDNAGALLTDTAGNGSAWIGAVTYSIGDGSNRRNTPGARRRVVSATQIAQAYTLDNTGPTPVYRFVGSVTLQVNVDSSANQYTTFGPPATPGGPPTPAGRRRIAPVDQPTFGILNPLAVQAGGYPLRLGAYGTGKAPAPGAVAVVPTNVANDRTGVLGPFGGVHSGTNITPTDLQAYANGNQIPRTRNDVPLNGVVAGVRTGRRAQRPVLVITATGDITHGTTGDNADPQNLNAVPPTGNQANTTPGYVSPNTASPNALFGAYSLNVADRSALGKTGQQIRNLTVQPAAVRWHDNSAVGTDNTYGPGAVVNALPWETNPVSGTSGTNTSLDYPDIGASRLGHTLLPNPQYQTNGGLTPAAGGDITNQAGSLDPAIGIDAASRTVYADPLQVSIRVPLFQPANLQVYDASKPAGTSKQTTPDQMDTNSVAFPQGYVSNETVYVDSNRNHRFDPGEAYREIRVFTGVPVDLSTAIQNTTVDLGRLPQSFGLQTEGFTAANGATDAAGNPITLGLFQPYPLAANSVYPQFFRPLTMVNKGNVNLLNLHLDQKTLKPDATGTNLVLSPVTLASDTLDLFDPITSLRSPFLAYDVNGQGGPYGGTLPGGVVEQPYLLRSTLDPDLVTVDGRNSGIALDGTLSARYPGATAHKARVGDTTPAPVTVPDVPRDNDPNLAAGAITPGATGTAGNFNLQIASVPTPGQAAKPFIGLAVPLGTPVGTYSLSLQAFEGLDPGGYKDIYTTTGGNNAPYTTLLPPLYGSAQINATTTTTPDTTGLPTPANLRDSLTLVPNGSRLTPLQPYSNATIVKATVTEARITNGASRGDLPQVDAGPTGTRNNNPAPSANFLPSAFRDRATGNISTYWTSSPRAPSATSPYTLVGANLGFSNGSFLAANTSGNWWKAIDLSAAPATSATSVNSGISAFTGDGGAYALVQNVAGGGGSPVTNNLYCYQVTPGTGALTGNAVPVSQNTGQASFGAKGLVFDPANFKSTTQSFPDAYPGSTQTITNNVWGFWYGGARGRSAISYASALSGKVNSYTANGPSPFSPTAVLPIPAGLASVSDPTAVLSYAQDPADNTKSIPVIEVTYTGTSADGNADIYVSRYRPYFVRKADNTTLAVDANGNNIVALALLPSPVISEQLIGTDGNLYFQARDVAWARNGTLGVSINNPSVNILAGIPPTFDRATGLLVYPRVALPTQTGTGTAYVDLARGRVRFSPQLPLSAVVVATFNSQARRITTDSRADTAPVAFIDMAQKPNEANNAGAGFGTVEADRYWYIWRKSGAPGTSTTPTLYFKTQRLTIDIVDGNTNQPVNLKLDSTGKPDMTVNVGGTGGATNYTGGTDIYTPASTSSPVDIDYVRGRLYFPLLVNGQASEGLNVHVTATTSDGGTVNFVDRVHWLDEPRHNDPATSYAKTNPPAFAPNSTGDAAIPIDTIVNESNVTAFLDPDRNQPHRVWLFWNSTRNGTADLYYETISPLFSASAGG